MDDPPYISRPARKVRQTRHLSRRDIYRRGRRTIRGEHLRGFGGEKRVEGKKKGGVLIAGLGRRVGDINGKECL